MGKPDYVSSMIERLKEDGIILVSAEGESSNSGFRKIEGSDRHILLRGYQEGSINSLMVDKLKNDGDFILGCKVKSTEAKEGTDKDKVNNGAWILKIKKGDNLKEYAHQLTIGDNEGKPATEIIKRIKEELV